MATVLMAFTRSIDIRLVPYGQMDLYSSDTDKT